jgi:Predicted membrane protein
MKLMRADETALPAPGPGDAAARPEHQQISQNLEAVLDSYAREERKVSRSQRLLERISLLIGQPAFLGLILILVAAWVLANSAFRRAGTAAFDAPPFFWLQGVVGLGALLSALVVLSRQSRLAKLAEQRAHLDLKVTLMTEQKTAKLIDLMEELRRDLPDVLNRHDPDAAVLQRAMSSDQVLATLDERGKPGAP